MILLKYRIIEFVGLNGRNPFRAWLDCLSERVAARIQARLYAVELGNFGDYKSVGSGVFELRLHLGPGYRIYFGREGAVVIVLLGGGEKGTQSRDIAKAKISWKKYTGGTHVSKKC